MRSKWQLNATKISDFRIWKYESVPQPSRINVTAPYTTTLLSCMSIPWTMNWHTSMRWADQLWMNVWLRLAQDWQNVDSPASTHGHRRGTMLQPKDYEVVFVRSCDQSTFYLISRIAVFYTRFRCFQSPFITQTHERWHLLRLPTVGMQQPSYSNVYYYRYS